VRTDQFVDKVRESAVQRLPANDDELEFRLAKDKSRQKGSGLLANIFGTSEGSDWHGLDCSNWLEVLFRQTCSRLFQNHLFRFLIVSPTQERRLPQLVVSG
jgi:hypothetical protein